MYFIDKRFKGFEKKRQPRAYQAMVGISDALLAGVPCESVLLYSSGYGVGKTHLISAVINRLVSELPTSRIFPALLITETDIMASVKASYNNNGSTTEEDILRALTDIQLLIVDDVGKYQARDSTFTQRIYYEIINVRYTRGFPIVLTSNLSPVALGDHIGGASADRLLEMCKGNIIELRGGSYRKEMANVRAKT